jgi:hypothetical protein
METSASTGKPTVSGRYSPLPVITLLLLAWFCPADSLRHVINGTSMETFQESSRAILEDLDTSQKKEFLDALRIISYSINSKNPENREKAEMELLRLLDRKSVAEIIELAQLVKPERNLTRKRTDKEFTETSVEFQNDADIFRLRHLKYMVELIEEYHRETDRYPLQGVSDSTNYVYIFNTAQEEYARQKPSVPHVITPLQVFIDSLEAGLDRSVILKYDAQRVSISKPNYYIYRIKGTRYVFTVHLFNKFSFAKKVGKHYNIVEVTNLPKQDEGGTTFQNLLADREFLEALGKPVKREEFFRKRENTARPVGNPPVKTEKDTSGISGE